MVGYAVQACPTSLPRAGRGCSGDRARKESSMRVTMLLADAAQVADGKLYILGGGWTITGPGPSPFAIALKFEVPWSRSKQKHRVSIDLLDADGRAVSLGGPDDPSPFVIEGEFEVDAPVGVPD